MIINLSRIESLRISPIVNREKIYVLKAFYRSIFLDKVVKEIARFKVTIIISEEGADKYH